MHATLVRAIALAALQVTPALSLAAAEEPANKAAAPRGLLPRPKLTISKETTVFTGPVLPDGLIDFLAAINEEAGRGITAESNAVVLLVDAFGPEAIDAEIRPEFYRLLGVTPGTQTDRRFVWADEFGERFRCWDALRKELDQLQLGRWKDENFPHVSRWVDANAVALARIAQAARRRHYYHPLLAVRGAGAPVYDALLSVVAAGHDATKALAARALRFAAAGDVDAAWRDIQTLRRLARLFATGRCNIEFLVGIVADHYANVATVALAHSERLTAGAARRMLVELHDLSDAPFDLLRLNEHERVALISGVMFLALRREDFGTVGLTPRPKLLEQLLTPATVLYLDWDEVLRRVHRTFDRSAAALPLPSFHERQEAFRWITERGLFADMALVLFERLKRSTVDRAVFSRYLGSVIVWQLFPAIAATSAANDRRIARMQLSKVTLALAAYRAEHGRYPQSLIELVPAYLREIPPDRFSDEPLRYKSERSGYVLYSVGWNERDDGGRDDPAKNQDDLVASLDPNGRR